MRIERATGYTPVLRYQYDNHLGSACLELDNAGAIISYEEYHPFGTTSYRSGRSETEVSLKRYKYCGKERDEETGLYYYGARYYAAWLGRFVSCDPLMHERPWESLYSYCGNNPINRVDLTGMSWDDTKKKGEDKSVTQNAVDTYKAEVHARIGFISNEMEKLEVGSEEHNRLAEMVNEYNTVLAELSDLANDPNNIYKINYGSSDVPTGASGVIKYGGTTKDGQNIININLATKLQNPLLTLETLSHELKHAHQYFEQRLGFLLDESGKQVDSNNSQPLEREAFTRGDIFSGKTMLNNRSFNMNPNLDANKYQLPNLPSYNEMSEQRIPIEQYIEHARKAGKVFIYNKNK